MTKELRLIAIVCLSISLFSCNKRSGKPKVLVFSKTSGYRHASIAEGKKAIIKLGNENGFDVDTTENAGYFTEDSLTNYSAVIFLSTTGDVLNNYQEADFERYIQAGGGYVGVHAATDCEYDWGWYGRLAGGYFLSHPEQQEATLEVVDQTNNSTKHLPKEWKRKDEWYNFKKLSKDVHVLIKINEKSYTGGKNGDDHPMAWYHDFDGGRAFYTELGHTDESYSDNNYLKHLLGGIQYAIGDNKKLNYSRSTTLRVPEENRFTKTSLVKAVFYEPTEMTVLPNLDVLVAQRRGELMLYKQSDKSIKQVGFLPVYFKALVNTKINAEEGLLGLKADPHFADNHFVYIFYSPTDTSVNRLSRFKFENDTLDIKSEKIILQFYSQREICCHTGGSIDFGGDGKTLFLSTGDNSTPFDEPNQFYVNHGFAPLNDQPGHEQYDARRSSGNTNDLRGKILRININEDGSYSIPDGNLFPKGTAKTRPEIYVMGDRNPYRIMVDKKTGYLYWGEVGPDANSDSLDTRGPRGYDEVNQARKAGYFGWPLFVGNNYPYHAYDYSTGANGTSFDPAKPINNSRNNTGLTELPPAQPAFIWYPYANSPDFPQTGTGGRNAMAGPVYYTDMYPKDTRLPDYYNNKLFIYDWIRGWIKVVTMQPNGDFDKMEPFIEHTKLANLIDMEVGPDGKLYLLEYGSGWFAKNPDAGLSRIDYNSGNRPAKLTNLQVNKRSGALPLVLQASIEASDPENDKLTYIWDLGNGIKKETTVPSLNYTIDKAGEYNVSVEVIDDKKASSTSDVISLYAGNEAPTVNIAIAGNKTFYFPGKQVTYNVIVKDNDDSTADKNTDGLVVSADYIEGSDKAGASMGHQVLTEATMGKNLMLTLDCKSCHKEADKSIGPSFTDVAKKYKDDPNAANYLVNKVIKGGGGVWGEVAMSAHPNLPEADARQIIGWVQSLAVDKKQKSLPASGKVNATLDKPASDKGILYISASYTDKGNNNIKPLSDQAVVSLRSNKISLGTARNMKEYTRRTVNGRRILTVPAKEASFSIDSVDLSLIRKASLVVEWQQPSAGGYTFDLYLDSPTGQKLASFDLPGGGKQASGDINNPFVIKILSAPIAGVNDGKLHNLYVVSKAKDAKESNTLSLSYLQLDL